MATGVPLIAPLVEAGLSPVGAIAVALSAVLVDINPLGITGGLMLGFAALEDGSRLFRHLMIHGPCAIVLGPDTAEAVGAVDDAHVVHTGLLAPPRRRA